MSALTQVMHVMDSHKIPNQLSESSTKKFGGLLANGKYAWFASEANFILYSKQFSSIMSSRSFAGNQKDKSIRITFVKELDNGDESYNWLLVGCSLKSSGILFICQLPTLTTIRCIDIPYPISYIDTIINEYFDEDQLCDEFKIMSTILLVGTATGAVYAIDLRQNYIENQCKRNEVVVNESKPNKLFIIRKNEDCQEVKEMSDDSDCHLAMFLNENFYTYCKKQYSGKLRLSISSLLYVKEINTVSIGYSTGHFQLWDCKIMRTIYLLREPKCVMPITHIKFLEPSDDPNNYCYLWLIQSDNSRLPIATMIALTYEQRNVMADGCLSYRAYIGNGIKLEMTLKRETGIGRCISALSICNVNLFKNETDMDEDCEIRLFAMLMEIRSSVDADPESYIFLFDINQWYKAQMPSIISHLKVSNSYASFVKLPQGASYLDFNIFDKTLRPFGYNFRNNVEELYYPSSIYFECDCLMDSEIVRFKHAGIQQDILDQLLLKNWKLLINPNLVFSQCLQTHLRPFFWDRTDDYANYSLPIKRSFVVSILVENKIMSVLSACAEEWKNGTYVSSEATILHLVQCLWKHVMVVKQYADKLCIPLFDFSGTLMDKKNKKLLKHCLSQMQCVKQFLDDLHKAYAVHITNVDYSYRVYTLNLVTQYFKAVTCFINYGLLPESINCNIQSNSNSLIQYANKRRSEFGNLQLYLIDAIVNNEPKGNKLIEQWLHEGCEITKGMYPPSNVQCLLRIYLNAALSDQLKHFITIYYLIDVCSSQDMDATIANRMCNFAIEFDVENKVLNALCRASWLLDHDMFEDAMEILSSDRDWAKIKDKSWDWFHWTVLKLLVHKTEYFWAQFYMRIVNIDIVNIEDHKFYINLQIMNDKCFDALNYIRARSIEEKHILFQYFFDRCRELKKFKCLIEYTWELEEETLFFSYLKKFNDAESLTFQLLFLLRRGKYLEAIELNKSLEVVSKLKSNDGLAIASILVNGYEKSIPVTMRQIYARPPLKDVYKNTERIVKCLNSDSKMFSIMNDKREHFVKINNSSAVPSSNPINLILPLNYKERKRSPTHDMNDITPNEKRRKFNDDDVSSPPKTNNEIVKPPFSQMFEILNTPLVKKINPIKLNSYSSILKTGSDKKHNRISSLKDEGTPRSKAVLRFSLPNNNQLNEADNQNNECSYESEINDTNESAYIVPSITINLREALEEDDDLSNRVVQPTTTINLKEALEEDYLEDEIPYPTTTINLKEALEEDYLENEIIQPTTTSDLKETLEEHYIENNVQSTKGDNYTIEEYDHPLYTTKENENMDISNLEKKEYTLEEIKNVPKTANDIVLVLLPDDEKVDSNEMIDTELHEHAISTSVEVEYDHHDSQINVSSNIIIENSLSSHDSQCHETKQIEVISLDSDTNSSDSDEEKKHFCENTDESDIMIITSEDENEIDIVTSGSSSSRKSVDISFSDESDLEKTKYGRFKSHKKEKSEESYEDESDEYTDEEENKIDLNQIISSAEDEDDERSDKFNSENNYIVESDESEENVINQYLDFENVQVLEKEESDDEEREENNVKSYTNLENVLSSENEESDERSEESNVKSLVNLENEETSENEENDEEIEVNIVKSFVNFENMQTSGNEGNNEETEVNTVKSFVNLENVQTSEKKENYEEIEENNIKSFEEIEENNIKSFEEIEENNIKSFEEIEENNIKSFEEIENIKIKEKEKIEENNAESFVNFENEEIDEANVKSLVNVGDKQSSEKVKSDEESGENRFISFSNFENMQMAEKEESEKNNVKSFANLENVRTSENVESENDVELICYSNFKSNTENHTTPSTLDLIKESCYTNNISNENYVEKENDHMSIVNDNDFEMARNKSSPIPEDGFNYLNENDPNQLETFEVDTNQSTPFMFGESFFGLQEIPNNKPALLFGQVYSFSKNDLHNNIPEIQKVTDDDKIVTKNKTKEVEIVNEHHDNLKLGSLLENNSEESCDVYIQSGSNSIQLEPEENYKQSKDNSSEIRIKETNEEKQEEYIQDILELESLPESNPEENCDLPKRSRSNSIQLEFEENNYKQSKDVSSEIRIKETSEEKQEEYIQDILELESLPESNPEENCDLPIRPRSTSIHLEVEENNYKQLKDISFNVRIKAKSEEKQINPNVMTRSKRAKSVNFCSTDEDNQLLHKQSTSKLCINEQMDNDDPHKLIKKSKIKSVSEADVIITRSKAKSENNLLQLESSSKNIFRSSEMIENSRQVRVSLSKNKSKSQESIIPTKRRSGRSKSLAPAEEIIKTNKKTTFGLQQIPEEDTSNSGKNDIKVEHATKPRKSKFSFLPNKSKTIELNSNLDFQYDRKIKTPRRSSSVQPKPVRSSVESIPKRSSSVNLLDSDEKCKFMDVLKQALVSPIKKTKRQLVETVEKNKKPKYTDEADHHVTESKSDSTGSEQNLNDSSYEEISPISGNSSQHMLLTPSTKRPRKKLPINFDDNSSDESIDTKVTRGNAKNKKKHCYVNLDLTPINEIKNETILSIPAKKEKTKLPIGRAKKIVDKSYEIKKTSKKTCADAIVKSDNDNSIVSKRQEKQIKEKLQKASPELPIDTSTSERRVTRHYQQLLLNKSLQSTSNIKPDDTTNNLTKQENKTKQKKPKSKKLNN